MLFRNENPNLGPASTVNEVALTATSVVTTQGSDLKPPTREFITLPLSAASALSGWLFVAPWKCQILGARFNSTTAGISTLAVEKIAADSIAPAAPNGTTIVNVLSTTVALTNTANTRLSVGPSTASGAAVLNPGDQLAYFIAATPTGLAGGILQVEISQLG